MLAALGCARAMVTPQCLATAKAARIHCGFNEAGLPVLSESDGMTLSMPDDDVALKPMGVVMTKEGRRTRQERLKKLDAATIPNICVFGQTNMIR